MGAGGGPAEGIEDDEHDPGGAAAGYGFAAAAVSEQCLFYSAFRQADLAAVEQFFRIGPQRNQRLRLQFGAEEVIAQEELDDLIVRDRQAQRLPPGANPA